MQKADSPGPFNHTRHHTGHLHVYHFVLLLEASEGQPDWRRGSGGNLPWAGSAFEVHQRVVVPDGYSIDGVMVDEKENFEPVVRPVVCRHRNWDFVLGLWNEP